MYSVHVCMYVTVTRGRKKRMEVYSIAYKRNES